MDFVGRCSDTYTGTLDKLKSLSAKRERVQKRERKREDNQGEVTELDVHITARTSLFGYSGRLFGRACRLYYIQQLYDICDRVVLY